MDCTVRYGRKGNVECDNVSELKIRRRELLLIVMGKTHTD